jgi:hypothetical protein
VDLFFVRRALLPEGELRFLVDQLVLQSPGRSGMRAAAAIERISSAPSGSNITIRFDEAKMRLHGLWLPGTWKWTWRGWRRPDGGIVRLNIRTHPLLAAPRLGFLPLLVHAAKHPVVEPGPSEAAKMDFQNGRYARACATYRESVNVLRRDPYGTGDATEFLLYCGDAVGAVRAFVGFEPGPFAFDSPRKEHLARIRLATGRYDQAEALLGGEPSYLLYEAIAAQNRWEEADEILDQVAVKDGLARMLRLRRSGSGKESRRAAEDLCSAFLTHRPAAPRWLARVFESCIAAGRLDEVRDRLVPAAQALPGLRQELLRFTRREFPEFLAEVEEALAPVPDRISLFH